MRIKVFEELFSLEKLFKTINKMLTSQYSVFSKSKLFNNSFLIIASASNRYIFITRCSIDHSNERIILSLVALDISSIEKMFSSNKTPKTVENYLYDLIIDNSTNSGLNPLKNISVEGLALSKDSKKILAFERNVFNLILPIIYEKFDYNDDLRKYPFSIFHIERTWQFWCQIYGEYLNKIEEQIIKSTTNPIKVYKYYDFALSKEIFQRIFDLIIIENEIEAESIPKNESQKTVKWMVFVYTHKKLKPVRLIDLLKLTEEIGKYAKLLRKQNLKKKFVIKTLIILISSQGYEKTIQKYLRDHLYHDFKHVFPMFIVPPINDKIWHNFKIDDGLSEQEIEAKKRAKRFITIHRNNSKLHTYMKHNIEDAKEHYSELIEKEKKGKENSEFIEKWAEILNIHKSSTLLNTKSKENRNKKEIKVLYE